MTDRSGLLGTLDRQTPTLFLLAGVGMIAFAGNTYLKTFVGTSYPVVQGIVAPVGFFLGVLGLAGFYVGLGDRPSTVARVAAGVTAVAAVGWVVIIAASIVSQGEPGGPLAVVPIVTIVSMILAFALFGITSLRSDVHSRTVGALLLLESAMFLLVIAGVPGYLIDTGHVLAYLGVGITLRAGRVPSESDEPARDAPV